MVAIRTIYLLAILLFGFSAHAAAQELDKEERYQHLVKEANLASDRCDSLQRVVAAARDLYLSEPKKQPELKSKLLRYEQELTAAAQHKEAAIAAVVAFERDWVVANVNSKPTPAPAVEVVPTLAIEDYPKRANLVENGYFIASLTAADMRSLRDMQRREGDVSKRVAAYHDLYDTMVALQLEYDRVDNQKAADSLRVELERVRTRAADVEDTLMQSWQTVYDNKIYLYNLALELNMRSDLLGEWERFSAEAQNGMDNDAGVYESDALSMFYNQKRALLSYEQHLASKLALQSAKDSLAVVAKRVNKESFCLPRVTLQERLFIDYEPLKVILPTIYNAKNPIPPTKIYERGTIYRIRVGIFTYRPNLSALRGITPLSYSDAYHDGKCAYFVGGFATEADAKEGVAYLKSIGFRDPLISMWVDGEYVADIEQWKRENVARYNIEISGLSTLSEEVKAHIQLRNEDSRISRVGKVFIVGEFISKERAETLAQEIVGMSRGATASVVGINNR
ncbi:MAG: hypothetical protein IIX04_02360 [Alistipes sp.]|nr:hypothetical protein [Alistipes sp.]